MPKLTGADNPQYKHGHTRRGHRLGWVNNEMWDQLVRLAQALDISANELTIRALQAYLDAYEQK